MFYMQRITWSGVAMHQGVVPSGPASHGCIRLPEAFARQMWGITKLGVRVIVTYGDVTPVAVSNDRLFALKRDTPEVKPEVHAGNGSLVGGQDQGHLRRPGNRPAPIWQGQYHRVGCLQVAVGYRQAGRSCA